MLTNSFTAHLKSKTNAAVLGLSAVIFLLGAPAANADEIYVELDGIEGESIRRGFEGFIDAVDWNWGLDQTGSMHMAKGAEAGKVNVQDLTFTHYLDKASPMLMQACATGRPIRTARLILQGSGESPATYFAIELEQVLVSSIKTGGDRSRPMEQVSLNFAKFKIKYWTQSPDGKMQATRDFGWSVLENREF